MSTEASSGTSRTKPKHRVQTIEQALRWAYQSELPKRRDDRSIGAPVPSRVHPMWAAGAFGGRIDNWNREPGFPLAMGDPHSDALRIEAAVDALDEEALDLAPYRIGEGLGAHVDLRHVASITRRDVRSWTITYARNSKRPELGGAPEFEQVRGANGKPVIWKTVQQRCGEGADGTPWLTTFDEQTGPLRGGVYPTGAFCKLHWTRNAEDVAEDRVCYALWHAGLAMLAEILRPVLQETAVTPIDLPMRPWIDGMPEGPTVHPNLRPRRQPVDTRRSVAMRMPSRPSEPGRSIPREEWPSCYRSGS